MADYTGPIFDADNHYYEAHDAFTRHVPKRMRARCVEWIELEGGRRYQVVGGKIDRTGNPTFDPISKPGVLREYFSGNPRNLTSDGADPLFPRAHAARVHGPGCAHRPHGRAGPRRRLALPHPGRALRGAAEEGRRPHSVPPSAPSISGWMRTGGSRTRIVSSPRPTSRWRMWTGQCEQLEWALARDARILVMRPERRIHAKWPAQPGPRGASIHSGRG